MKIAFIVNSKIRHLKDFQKQFEICDHELKEHAECFYTRYPKHATDLAARILEFDIIVAVGGDGTLHEVINGVLDRASENKRSVPVVGLLPYGTANDFARAHKISKDVNGIFELISHKLWQPIDIGEMRHPEGPSYFINIADVGFGGEVVQRMHSGKFFFNKLPSNLKFLSAMTRSFISYRNKETRIVAENFFWEGRILTVVIANSSTFASGLQIAPHASINSGTFQIVIIGNISMFEYIRFLPKIREGEQIDHPEVHYLSSSQIEVTADELQHIEADGEFVGRLPLEIVCHPGKIRFILP